MRRENDRQREPIATFILVLRILVVLQLIIAVLNIVSVDYFLKHGIFGIFLAFVLFMAQKELSYQILLIDVIVSLFFTFDFLLAFLTYFQNGTNVSQLESKQKFDFSVIFISFVFYAIVAIFTYFPYKHFKRVSYKQNPALNHIFQHSSESNEPRDVKEVPYIPAYGEITVDPRQKNNEHGTFEVSKGQGIKL